MWDRAPRFSLRPILSIEVDPRNLCPFFAKFFIDRQVPRLSVHIHNHYPALEPVQRLSFFRPVLRVYEQGGETAMIRIEGIPVVAARLADAEKAKSRQTRNKQPKSHLLPIALQPARLRPILPDKSAVPCE